MVFDRSEHEPEEYDPEAEFEDPESNSLTIPQVQPPGVTPEKVEETLVPSSEDVPTELARTFWVIVLVINAGLLALSIGVMFLIFRGDVSTAGPLLLGGALLLALAYRRYRAFERSEDVSVSDDSATAGSEPDTSTAETVSLERDEPPTSDPDQKT